MAILPPKPQSKAKEARYEFLLRLTPGLGERLAQLADETGYSRNEIIVRFVELGVQKYEEEKKTKK